MLLYSNAILDQAFFKNFSLIFTDWRIFEQDPAKYSTRADQKARIWAGRVKLDQVKKS